ncbi:uncharacterized protein LOC107001169 [Solanum pennellii]|uniref:Uncharacterized protein LOC107001169 n=1 Tax=Solanum pennellii TaxID=28526 RepID=A0ABM1FCB7_SOLPN|nr:uncharacterized protein LOC107001169 [Solanum pennellii]
MSNLSKLVFVALNISGKNYLSWVVNAEIHMVAKGLDATITQENESSSQDKAKAMIFLRHHLDEGLKIEYLTVKDSLELWTDSKGRYDHLKATVLPRARYEWMHLRFQDNLPQYREKGFHKYSELISCLLVAEKHNALLMKNHEARPTRAAPLLEANVVGAAVNAPVRVDIPTGQIVKANESRPHFKRGRPIGFKYKNPEKRKGINDQDYHGLKKISQDETQVIIHDEEEVLTSEKNEISMNYVSTKKLWNRNNIVIDNTFAYNVAIDIMQQDEDF